MNDPRIDREVEDLVDIGPECFGLKDGSQLSWRGVSYVPQKETLRVKIHNWLVARYNEKRSR